MCVLDIQKLKYSQLFSDICLAVSTVDSEQLYREFCSIFSVVLDANGKQKHDIIESIEATSVRDLDLKVVAVLRNMFY